MATRAVVLSGGGSVGIAWEAGIAAGLLEEGVDLGEAGLFVGTSAGSVVGSQLALGRSPKELFEDQLARAAGAEPARAAGQPQPDTSALIEKFREFFTSGARPEELRAQIGAFALSAKTMSEDAWLATFGRTGSLGVDGWPERRFVCTAVDTVTGAFVAWDKESGVGLGRAVASSCAVPGIFPPVTINGRRYMDGGMRSGTNADLASGYDTVVVLAVRVAGAAATGPRAAMAEQSRLRLEREMEGLRAGGSTVELIVPDEESVQVFGENLLDASRRTVAAEAGLLQGRAEAPRLRGVWGAG